MAHETTIDAGTSIAALAHAVRPRAYLLVRLGEGTRTIDVRDGDELVIGRASDAAIQIESGKASREHARIVCTDGSLVLTDLGSKNGTRVNQVLLEGVARPLAAGDVIWIGDAEILVAGTAEERLLTPANEPADGVVVPGLVVTDEAMVEVFRLIDRIAPQDIGVLLLGETGVGKEVVAEQIHVRSRRAQGPFVRINCGALPDNLLESELFGHERGAFTGADRRKIGLFETAQNGTLFLDEIGELKLELQAKLLRALAARRLTRIGGREEIEIDVRIIAASNRNLELEAKEGRFRPDLYYRLASFSLSIPPLRDRPNEIGLLAELFARQLANRMGKAPPELHPLARAVLEAHDWPGNVRELRNVIERALVLLDGNLILVQHLPDSLRTDSTVKAPRTIRDRVESLEELSIKNALSAEKGNQTRAARRLGISRRTLIYKMEKYQLRERDRGA